MKRSGDKKIGLFGGTFNPIHLGHLRAAEEIREILDLKKIYFIPTSVPPHKSTPDIATPKDRLKMVELAIDGNDFFDICDFEIRREGKSFTVDTLRYFSSSFPELESHFIVGTELFSEIDSWKDYKILFELSNFIVIERPGFSFDYDSILPLEFRNYFRYYKEYNNLTLYIYNNSKILSLVKIDGLQISSTKIRELIKEKKSIKYLVSSKVESYILSRNIYFKEADK